MSGWSEEIKIKCFTLCQRGAGVKWGGHFIRYANMSMEEKLAKWASSIVGGSIVLPVLLILATFSIPKIISGEILNDFFLLKSLIITIFYSTSIYLLATLQGKAIRRRFLSWLYSILFHAFLLVYLGFFNEFGNAVFVLGIIELIVLLLSILGFSLLIIGTQKSKNA